MLKIINLYIKLFTSNSFYYYIIKLYLGSNNIFFKSSIESCFNYTLIGSLPNNSGIKSVGLDELNAPPAMKRISIFI